MLRPVDVAVPKPGAGCALIRVEAIGVNFVDVYYRSGQYPSELPMIPGMEATTGGGHVFFTRAEMDAWIEGCRAGEFDDLGEASTP